MSAGSALKCAENHPQCAKPSSSFIPSRVIDVGTINARSLRLWHPDAPVDYIALSYCWDKINMQAESFVATRANHQSRISSGIPFNSLPRTLREACRVAQVLGVRYIWIDSLCIIQDDDRDWDKESGLMSDIYANSLLTITALASCSVYDGLSLTRPDDTVKMILPALDLATNRALTFHLVAPPNEGTNFEMNMIGDWNKRGWTLQERLLSPRILCFTRKLLYFQCRRGSFPESDAYEPDHLAEWSWIGAPEPLKAISTTFGRQLVPGPPDGLYTTWYKTISSDYYSRLLSNFHDRLPAISGLAKVLIRQLSFQGTTDEYLAGLWRNDLVFGLSWQVYWHGQSLPRPEYRAPSWSWASFHDNTRKARMSWAIAPPTWPVRKVQLIKVLDATVQPAGNDVTGRVKDGWIVLKGQLVRAQEIVNYQPTFTTLFKPAHTLFPDYDQLNAQVTEHILALLVGADHRRSGNRGCEDLVRMHGLLLRAIGTSDESGLGSRLGPKLAGQKLRIFERYGTFDIKPIRERSTSSLFPSSPEEIVVL